MKFNLSKLKTAAKPTAQDLENQLRAELAPLAEMYQQGKITQKDIYRLLGTTIKNYQNEIIAEELERFRKPVQDLTRQITKLKPDYDPSEILSEVMSSINVAVIPELRRLYILAKKRTEELFKEISITTEPEKQTWGTFVEDEKTRILDDTKTSFKEFSTKISGMLGNLSEDEVKVLIRNIPQPANIEKNPELLANRFSGIDSYFSTNIVEKNPLPESMAKYVEASKAVFSFLTGIRNKAKETWTQYMSGKSPAELSNLPSVEKQIDIDPWNLLEQAGFQLSALIGPVSYWKVENKSGNIESDSSVDRSFNSDDEIIRKVQETVAQGYDDDRLLYILTDPKELQGNPILNDPNYRRLRALFTEILRGNRSRFKDILVKAGFNELPEIVERVDKLQKDPVYADFNLYVRSRSESKLYKVLRDEFDLNPLPYESNMRMPSEFPWGSTIKTDFLLPADVIQYSGSELTIKRQIVFTGEYLEGRTKSEDPKQLYGEKQFLGPDGKPHKFNINVGGISISKDMKTGVSVKEQDIYNATADWKKVAQPVVASMIGSASLYFTDEDTRSPFTSAAKKLDQHFIIYDFAGCNDDTCVAMNLLKKVASENPNSEAAKYLSTPKEFDQKKKQLDYLDVVKANFLMSRVFSAAIEQSSSNSFTAESMYAHFEYLKQLNLDEQQILREYRNTPDQNEKLKQIAELKSSLNNSPMKEFKDNFEEAKNQERFARILAGFDYLKELVRSTDISDVDLRVKTNDLQRGLNIMELKTSAERIKLIRKYASS
jgi:hypothetical protein